MSGGRSASRVAFFDGAPASTASGYATCAEAPDTKIREMSLRIQLSGFGGQDNRKCVCGSQVSLAASTFVHLRARLQ
ncbi:hypothetical protein EGY20_18065 [Burkholderia multivorans]|nr:hypothetical protein EGY20_18065 [Burkholderia multivorans]